jgi:hypothetical protein
MIYIFLQIKPAGNSIQTLTQTKPLIHDLWFWISIVEAFIIIFFIIKKIKTKTNLEYDEKIIKESKNKDIYMGNLMNSIHQSKSLYDTLKKKCHPDRFPDHELNKIADSLFQEITLNKRNYNKLLELKEVAERELNINF